MKFFKSLIKKLPFFIAANIVFVIIIFISKSEGNIVPPTSIIGGFLSVFIITLLLIKFPLRIYLEALIFDISAVCFGSILRFYSKIAYYDKFVHFMSGLILADIGIVLIDFILKKEESKPLPRVSLIFAAIFSFAGAAIWEIYEFAGDTLLGLNMQKCLLQDGTELVGKAAVADTMKDLIVDAIGAVIAAACSAFSLKKKSEWIFPCKTVETSQHTVQTALSNEALTYTA